MTLLNKPVQKIITNYHVGGTGNHDVVMIEGMPDFVKGAVYGGMMQNFAKIFGDAIIGIDRKIEKTKEKMSTNIKQLNINILY